MGAPPGPTVVSALVAAVAAELAEGGGTVAVVAFVAAGAGTFAARA